MKKTIEKLIELRLYLNQKALGHTTLMLNGANNNERRCIIMSENKISTKSTKGEESISVSWKTLSPISLKGYRLPLAIDNYSLEKILSDALSVINELNTDVLELQKKLNEIKQIMEEK